MAAVDAKNIQSDLLLIHKLNPNLTPDEIIDIYEQNLINTFIEYITESDFSQMMPKSQVIKLRFQQKRSSVKGSTKIDNQIKRDYQNHLLKTMQNILTIKNTELGNSNNYKFHVPNSKLKSETINIDISKQSDDNIRHKVNLNSIDKFGENHALGFGTNNDIIFSKNIQMQQNDLIDVQNYFDLIKKSSGLEEVENSEENPPEKLFSIEKQIEAIKDYQPKKKTKSIIKKNNLIDIIGLIADEDINSDDHDI